MEREDRLKELYVDISGSLRIWIKKANGRKIILWGASLAGEATKMVLDEMGVSFEGYIDSNEVKAGQLFCGKEIFAPSKIANKSDEYFVVIASSFYKSIKNQLFYMGYTEADMCGTGFSFYMPAGACDSVQLGITNRCNLKCHFCICGTNKEKDSYFDMTKETAMKIIDNIVEAGIERFNLSGTAENTLHKDYIEILKYAASRFKHVIITTNGHALAKEIRDAILSTEYTCKITVLFSVTGFSAETYNQFQGSGRHNNTDKLRNNLYKIIDDFIDERNAKNKDVKIGVKYMISDDNLDDFRKYVNYWSDKVESMLTYPMLGENCVASSCGKIKKSDIRTCIQIRNASIIANGVMQACCFGEDYIGNVIDTPISEILSSDKYMKIVDSISRLDYENLSSSCKNCGLMFYNDFTIGVDYLKSRKFDYCMDKISKLANERSVLLFVREQEMDELFYSIFVNEKIEILDISISDPYEKGYYERFEIQQPSVNVFKDKLVICFNDYELKRLAPEIKEGAYKIVSVSDILEG